MRLEKGKESRAPVSPTTPVSPARRSRVTPEGLLIREGLALRSRAARRLSAGTTRAAHPDQPPTVGRFIAPAAGSPVAPDGLPVCWADTRLDTSATPAAPQNRT